jgi:hypothetical protein
MMTSSFDSGEELEPQAAAAPNIEEIYEELKQRALDEALYAREEWEDLVEETLQEKIDRGEMPDDDSYMEILETLKGRFDEFRLEIPESV